MGRTSAEKRMARRRRLLHVQHGRCFYCHKVLSMIAPTGDDRAVTFDHVFPKSKATDNMSNIHNHLNLVVSCETCNRSWGNTHKTFKEVLKCFDSLIKFAPGETPVKPFSDRHNLVGHWKRKWSRLDKIKLWFKLRGF